MAHSIKILPKAIRAAALLGLNSEALQENPEP